MKFIQLILFLLALISASAQSETKIDPANFDYVYLEKLVVDKINEVRTENDCTHLVQDPMLYKAAKFHTDYMAKNKVLSHLQKKNKSMQTPQKRSNHFSSERYNVGENILYSFYNSNVVGKKNAYFKTSTYEILADAILHSWLNSPGHFANMITPAYSRSGLAISIDPKTKRVYVCQDFAKVPTQ